MRCVFALGLALGIQDGGARPAPEKVVGELVAQLRSGRIRISREDRRALLALAKEKRQGRSVWRALYVLWLRGKALKDPGVLAEHLERFSPAGVDGWTAGRFEAAIQHLKGARILGWAYFDEWVMLGADQERLEALAERLGLRKSGEIWGNREGELVWELRRHMREGTQEHAWAMERYRRDEFSVAYVRAAAGIQAAARNPDLLEPVYDWVRRLRKTSPSPDHITALARTLKKFFRCRRCHGKGSEECSTCKGAGERTAVCSRCGGKGRLFKGVSARTGRPVVEDCPGCNGKGRWQVRCRTCRGRGSMDCPRCDGPFRAPALEDIVKEKPCETCGGRGTLFGNVRVPCPHCFGLGRFLLPAGNPRATLEP